VTHAPEQALNDYAFGWFFLPVAKAKLVRMVHNGSFAGFLAFIERNVAEDRTLVFMSNTLIDLDAIVRVYEAMPPKGQQK
jgi:hypothetical protein